MISTFVILLVVFAVFFIPLFQFWKTRDEVRELVLSDSISDLKYSKAYKNELEHELRDRFVFTASEKVKVFSDVYFYSKKNSLKTYVFPAFYDFKKCFGCAAFIQVSSGFRDKFSISAFDWDGTLFDDVSVSSSEYMAKFTSFIGVKNFDSECYKTISQLAFENKFSYLEFSPSGILIFKLGDSSDCIEAMSNYVCLSNKLQLELERKRDRFI